MKICASLIVVCISFTALCQIAKAPNKSNSKGQPVGQWVVGFDQNWKKTSKPDSISFYRVVTYKNGKPTGIVRDHFRSGKMQWEGRLISDAPSDVYDGVAKWYYENGQLERHAEYSNGALVSEELYHPNGKKREWEKIDIQAQQAFADGKWQEALDLFVKGRELAEKEFGKDDANYATALDNLGVMSYYMGSYAVVEPLYLEALAIRGKIFGRKNSLYANSLNNLAVWYEAIGKYALAESYYMQTLEVQKETLSDQDLLLGMTYVNIGNFYRLLSNYTQAEIYHQKALQIRRQSPQAYASSLIDMARLAVNMGQYKKAEAYCKEALDIQTKALGENHIEIGITLQTLGDCYYHIEGFRNAEVSMKRALVIFENTLGKDHDGYADLLSSLGVVSQFAGNVSAAEKYFEQALTIGQPGGVGHANRLNNTGFLYLMTGRPDLALTYFEKTVQTRKDLLGELHPDYAHVLNNMGMAWMAKKEYNKAAPLFHNANRVFMRMLKREFTSLSESERQQLMQLHNTRLERFNSFALTMKTSEPSITAEMYDNQLFAKSLLFSTSSKIRRRILNSGDTAVINLYNRWHAQRQYITKMYTFSIGRRKKLGIDLVAAEQEANALEKQLSSQSQLFASSLDTISYTWKDIREKLNDKEAAIEMVRFRKFNTSFTDTVYYAALIVTKSSTAPEIVLLRNGKDLEHRELKYYRNMIRSQGNNTRSYEVFWKPVAEVLKKKRVSKIFFSPDGVYHSININTLQNPATKKYVLNEMEIIITGNTKMMMGKNALSGYAADASLFGFPDYHNSESRSSEGNAGPSAIVSEEIARFFSNGEIQSLPGTREEVINVDSILSSSKVKVARFQGLSASESELKRLSNPGILHIATHGFFLNDLPDVEERGFAGFEGQRFVENPMLRAGLLMAGSQKSIVDPHHAENVNEDGILTAHEASTLNLDKTQLVVLSACETGLGEIRNGEGVYGLQRAFQIAGAKNVLMSLWKVDDRATQELMEMFYSAWAKSGDASTAFTMAQKSMMKKYKQPYYWGAFILVKN